MSVAQEGADEVLWAINPFLPPLVYAPVWGALKICDAILGKFYPSLTHTNSVFVFGLFTGSFATATCMVCHNRVDCECVRDDIMNQV